jgi:hypothetical protein
MRSRAGTVIVAAAAAGLALVGCAPKSATIRLDPGTRFQTVTGWEVSSEIVDSPSQVNWRGYRDAVIARAVDEIGIDRLRLEIRSGAESRLRAWSRFASGEIDYAAWRPIRYVVEQDNDDPRVIDPAGFDWSELDFTVAEVAVPLRERLARRGERLFVNLCYVAFTDQIVEGGYSHDDPEEYAELILAAFLHMKERWGFVPDSVEVVLEPDLVAQWSPELLGRAIVATAARLREHGFAPGFVAPSVTDMANAVPWFDGIAQVAGAVDEMIELSYHRYRSSSREHLPAIVERAHAHGLAPAMLEWWFGHGTYDVLFEDLALGMNTAWQGRVLKGQFDVSEQPDGGFELKLREDVRYNLQIYREVRRGALRIGARSSEPEHFAPLAFVNTDGSTVVVIKALGAGEITVADLPPGAYAISYAVADGSRALAPVAVAAGAPLSFAMPGPGVATVSGRRPRAPAAPAGLP